jgi:hypothetical protein
MEASKIHTKQPFHRVHVLTNLSRGRPENLPMQKQRQSNQRASLRALRDRKIDDGSAAGRAEGRNGAFHFLIRRRRAVAGRKPS